MFYWVLLNYKSTFINNGPMLKKLLVLFIGIRTEEHHSYVHHTALCWLLQRVSCRISKSVCVWCLMGVCTSLPLQLCTRGIWAIEPDYSPHPKKTWHHVEVICFEEEARTWGTREECLFYSQSAASLTYCLIYFMTLCVRVEDLLFWLFYFYWLDKCFQGSKDARSDAL